MALEQLLLYKEAKKKEEEKDSMIVPAAATTAAGLGIAGGAHAYKNKIYKDMSSGLREKDIEKMKKRMNMDEMSTKEMKDSMTRMLVDDPNISKRTKSSLKEFGDDPDAKKLLSNISKYEKAKMARIGGAGLAGAGALWTAYEAGKNHTDY